jgi:ADP-ribose pyrophosphatase
MMEVLSFDVAHDYGVFRVKRLVTRAPRTGKTSTYHIVDRPNSVQVVAVTAHGQLLLVEQHRHGSQQRSLEFVAGLLEGEEEPASGAARELEEETGYRAQMWQQLGWYYNDPAIMTSRVYVFLAEGCTPTGKRNQDEGEAVEIRLCDAVELPHLIETAGITHGLSVAAWHLYQSRVQRSRSRT